MPAAVTLLLALATATSPAPTSVPAPTASAPAPTANAPAPAPECPAPAQLAAALNALMPGLAPALPPTLPLLLANGGRLAVATSPEGDMRVDLVDAQGETVLHRVLPAPPRGHAPDCPALAETTALIVDRYLHDVGYEAPPLPPPAPRPAPPPAPPTAVVAAPPAAPPAAPRALWRLGVAGGARLGDTGGLDSDADLALGVESATRGTHWGGRLSAGYAPPAGAQWANKTASLRRVPLRLGLYLSLPAGPGRLEPGLGAGADMYVVSVSGPGSASGVHAAPSGDAALGYALPLAGSVYLRVLTRIALTVPFTFKALEVGQVFGTPRVYGEAGVELGLAFR